MAMTVAECDAMIAAADRSGKTLMIAHSQQFFPVNETVRAMIAAGEIGRIVFATDTWYKPFYADPRPPWFLDAAKGGGMWPMNGPHLIDRMTMFIGSHVVAVKAMVGTHFVDVPRRIRAWRCCSLPTESTRRFSTAATRTASSGSRARSRAPGPAQVHHPPPLAQPGRRVCGGAGGDAAARR